MEIRSLEELQAPDERTLGFTPLGLGGLMKPEDAAAYQQELVASADLVDLIPEPVRKSFERVRKVHSYGVLDYEMFTVAHDQAQLVLEYALRERFVEYFGGTATFVDDNDTEHQLTFTSVEDLRDELGRRRPRRRRRSQGPKPPPWRVRTRRTSRLVKFDGMLTGLLAWAREEGLLNGAYARFAHKLIVEFRNRVAHHAGYYLLAPVESTRAIRDLAEIINQLWGVPTRDGRLHPAPLGRSPFIIGWDPTRRIIIGPAEQLFRTPPNLDLDEFTYLIALAVPYDPWLDRFDARFETTVYPTEWLWGPGAWSDALAWFTAERPEPDTIDPLDRHLLVRFNDGRLYLPQQVPVAAGLLDEDRTGHWYLVRADFPNDAFNHLRQKLTGNRNCAERQCRQCAVEIITEGAWEQVMEYLTAIENPLVARTTPDACTPLWSLRWNEIHADYWTVPSPW
ncbi:hypothetical protein Sme01_45040 [Sphaerisporangium melleum]|uniref:Uncharacterized protein n=1 Tax=Sphaerisporangium melleum TaxID=321316 RepID=A0A917R0T7_9ACTN|nr:hypothetical protein [Sphaerisporangium melleum]GGK80580.1 hypothetical protein GCM10007964_24050 [Sphaerisporangium melleum]GII72028.1 hypothetical protein Sme01_45040 [Sphaerisporangium melleum]